MKHNINIAPMMDWTDRHCRYFLRLLHPHARLYTEMVTATALKHGDADRLLKFDSSEHPLALQLGGSDPRLMASAAAMGAAAGFDEININVGCPSDRVQSGQFGACLMANPETVAECVVAMRNAVDIPVTIKSRIGIDNQDSYEFLQRFVDITRHAGCEVFVVHARKAILEGLSPKDNRSVPPLNYERVYKLKRDNAELRIILNGGVNTVDECRQHLKHVDGLMIGRQAYQNPWFLVELDATFGNVANAALLTRQEVVAKMIAYIEQQLKSGTQLNHITRHMLGLYAGQPGARSWRRYLSEYAHRPGAGVDVLENALAQLPNAA